MRCERRTRPSGSRGIGAVVGACLLTGGIVTAEAREPDAVFDVWPGAVPGETGDIPAEQWVERAGGKPVKRLTNVTKPTLSVFRAPKEKHTGAAVMVCPGGGYSILAWDLEGTEVADWLNSHGVTAFVLKYRVPRRSNRPKHEAPLQDAQRALSVLRSRAKEWDVDPARLGILGFSAGGHLSVCTATNSDRRSYPTVDETDRVSCRPDFAILIYPAYLVEKDALVPEVRVTKESPPMFFAHAGDDGIGPENSIGVYQALKKAGVAAELHVYTNGGHGFGLRPTDFPCSTWPARAAEWLANRGLLKPAAK